jgi:hypothetical protein
MLRVNHVRRRRTERKLLDDGRLGLGSLMVVRTWGFGVGLDGRKRNGRFVRGSLRVSRMASGAGVGALVRGDESVGSLVGRSAPSDDGEASLGNVALLSRGRSGRDGRIGVVGVRLVLVGRGVAAVEMLSRVVRLLLAAVRSDRGRSPTAHDEASIVASSSAELLREVALVVRSFSRHSRVIRRIRRVVEAWAALRGDGMAVSSAAAEHELSTADRRCSLALETLGDTASASTFALAT